MTSLDERCAWFEVLPADYAATFIDMTAESERLARSKYVGLRSFELYMRSKSLTLASLTEDDMRLYMEEMLGKHTANTANVYLLHARTFLEWLTVEGYDVPTGKSVWYQRLNDDGSRYSKTLDEHTIIKVLKATRIYSTNEAGLRDAIAINLTLRYGIGATKLVAMNIGDLVFEGSAESVLALKDECVEYVFSSEIASLIKRYFDIRDNPPDTAPFLASRSTRNYGKRLGTESLGKLVRLRLSKSGVPYELCSMRVLLNSHTRFISFGNSELDKIEEILNRNVARRELFRGDPRMSAAVALDSYLNGAK